MASEEEEYEHVVVPLREGKSFLSDAAREKMAEILNQPLPDTNRSAREEEEGLWFGRGGAGSAYDHRPFAELCSLSGAARDSAAPHIRNIYEEVFMSGGVFGENEGVRKYHQPNPNTLPHACSEFWTS